MSLFTDRPETRQEPSSFVVSILVHGVIASVFSLGLVHSPRISDPALSKRYDVRHLELHARQQPLSPSSGSAGGQHGSQSGDATQSVASQLAASWQIPQLAPAEQTLVEPDLPRNLALRQKPPLPTVVVWSPKQPADKTIVPPPPQAEAANVHPSLDAPVAESQLADLSVASVDTDPPLPLLIASTTSPVALEEPEPQQMAPSTTSQASATAPSAAALSLSDLRMPEGTVTLPPANETAPNPAPTTPTPGISPDSLHAGEDNHAGNSADAAPGQGDPTATNGSASAAAPGDGAGNEPSADHISLAKNGHFGVVVVGSTLAEEYPDLLQIWGGRVAYTVYLQIGKATSWILQYSLAPSSGLVPQDNVASLEAPWPYEIVRPHMIPLLLDADAMVLHGVVNRAGRFESLAVVYPARAPQGTLVLNSLAQWQFRPARQNGAATAVEVVLVIPNEAL